MTHDTDARVPPRARGSFQDDPLGFLLTGHRDHGPVFTTTLNRTPTVIVGSRTPIDELFGAERTSLAVTNTPLVHDLFGNAVFNLTGESHRRARRTLRPALTGQPLLAYALAVQTVTGSAVRRWGLHPPTDVHAAARALTLDVAEQVVVGLTPTTGDAAVFREAFAAFVAATGAPAGVKRWASGPYWEGRRARRALHELFTRRAAGPMSPNVLGHLAAAGAAGADGGTLQDHLLALLIAAQETTASLLTWFLIELADHERLQEDVAAEARTALRAPSLLTDRRALPVLRAAMAEVGRLHSPNVLSVRKATARLSVGGYTIPAGWHVAYSPSANHFDMALFTEPFTFWPERRTSEPTMLLTFGRGAHACVGKHFAELIVLATVSALLARWRISLPAGRPRGVRHLPAKAPDHSVPIRLEPIQGPA